MQRGKEGHHKRRCYRKFTMPLSYALTLLPLTPFLYFSLSYPLGKFFGKDPDSSADIRKQFGLSTNEKNDQ